MKGHKELIQLKYPTVKLEKDNKKEIRTPKIIKLQKMTTFASVGVGIFMYILWSIQTHKYRKYKMILL